MDPTPAKPGAGDATPISPSTGAPLNKDILINMVSECKRLALTRCNTFFRRTARWYDLYRGTYTMRGQAFRNNITIPFLFSVIQSDVARKVQTSFGAWPIVEFTGYSHSDSGIARKNSTLVSAQMKDCDSFTKAVDFFTMADLYGTAIARVGWKTERKLARLRVPGANGETIKEFPQTSFDGPDWVVVDILDFLPQPGKARIKDMDWVIHRRTEDLDKLIRDAKEGMYDLGAVMSLTSTNLPTDNDREWTERHTVYRTYGNFANETKEKVRKPVAIDEWWGFVPQELADAFFGGVTAVKLVLANNTKLIAMRENPFWHQQIPFRSYCPMPDPHYFHGPGKMEIGEKMQFAANRYANQRMDNLDVSTDSMWLVDISRGIDTQNLFTKAGKVIGINGPVGDDVIRPLSPDLRGTEMSQEEIMNLWQWIQQGTGIIEDTVQGAPASRRQTAREFQGRQENVLTRLMLETRLAEEGFVEPLANDFVALNKQFLPMPKQVPILGNDAIINPITGFPYPQEPIELTLQDINHDYKARATGATQMLGKNVRQQNFMALMQVMGANPVGAQMVNWANFFKQVFEAFDMRNFDELINTQPTQVNQNATNPPNPMDAALANPGGSAALGAAPGHGDLPPDLTAAILQQVEGNMPSIAAARGY